MVKQNSNIKFIFDINLRDKNSLDDIFNKLKSLNIRFDNNLIPYSTGNNVIYEFDDVSKLDKSDIQLKINSFFNFTFKDFVNVDLYKFLVLKNMDKLTILAIIHPLIFDYTSINRFYNLFNNNTLYYKNVISYYHNLDKYFNSNDFKEDSEFWENYLSNSEDYVKFYNISSNNYKKIKIPLNQIEYNKFNFITGVFSLYLSRYNQSKGCILKTCIPKDNNDLDITTLLKIDYHEDISFNDYLNHVNDVYDSAIQHSRVNIENYMDYDCFYSVYDFSDLKNIEVVNGEGSALTLNIYDDYLDLIYNADLFSDVYMEHMIVNIEYLINNISDYGILCRNIDIVSDNEKNFIFEFSKGETVPFDKNTSLSKIFHENAKKFSDKLAIDDGVNQISYGELDVQVILLLKT